jgi:hypothetical protein
VIAEYLMLAAVLGGVSVSLIYCWITGISPIPSSAISKAAILDALPETLNGPVYELGAGWGSLAWPLAAAFPDAHVVAFELSPVPWAFMMARQALFPRENLTVLRRNFLKADLGDAAAVVCYLHPGALAKLAPRLQAQARAGTPLVSNTFEVAGWQPDLVRELEDSFCPTIYRYHVPGRDEAAPAAGPAVMAAAAE